MRYLLWLLKAALFFIVFAFALNNQGDVRLHLLFGAFWDAPLVLVLLATLTLGLLLGIAVMLPVWWRARRQARHASAPPLPAPAEPTTELPPHGI